MRAEFFQIVPKSKLVTNGYIDCFRTKSYQRKREREIMTERARERGENVCACVIL